MAQNEYGVKMGDVFKESWGYDQTNVDFYQVVKVMPKSVEVKPIWGKAVGEGHSTRLKPDVGNFKEGNYAQLGARKAGKRKLVQQYEHHGETTTYLTMSSYSSAYLVDPEESHFDTIAAGYPGH